jgi:bla regulator protein BlaR1
MMMDASLIHGLTSTTVSSSLALVLVGLLRRPLRMMFGARAAYWLWLLVPASALAVLLPGSSQRLQMLSGPLRGYVSAAVTRVASAASSPDASRTLEVAVLMIWAAGVGVMLTLMLTRQRAFVRSLGKMVPDAQGIRRSGSIVAPMLVGAWRGQVVVPLDFEVRYNHEERQLVLAHERAHRLRCDVSVNALAAGWLCIFWFNPLMYWAIGGLRLDQELACDALVLGRSGAAPRRYADTLLKTQLATQSVWRMPVGCHWQSSHPLKERVAMLARPLPGVSRRFAGIVFALLLSLSGSYAAWAVQPQARLNSTAVLVKMKLTVTSSTGTDTKSAATEVLANAGVRAAYLPAGHPYDVRCAAFLPDEDRQSPAWDDQRARGIPLPAEGQILLECKISQAGKVISSPSVIAAEGELATMEFYDTDGSHHIRLELNAVRWKGKGDELPASP